MSAPVTIDLYSPLSHKSALGAAITTQGLAPSWVPATELRRLNAYRIRAAYLLNVARFMAGAETEIVDGMVRRTVLDDRREYGDPALLVDRIIAGVLGDTIEIVVDGADADLPDEPELPPAPDPLPDGATPLQQRIHAARMARWEQAATEIVSDWERAWAEQPALQARQEWLREWGDDEQLPAKLVEGEWDTCGLADGVYVLSWSAKKRRPLLSVYDPGMYFPVLTDDTRDFPTKVHLAWEFEETAPDGTVERWVRRITWELAPITTALDENGAPRFDNGNFVLRGPIRLADGKLLTDRFASAADIARGIPAGSVVRDYPWNVDDEGKPVPSAVTCYMTDARWRFGALDARKVTDFDESKAVFAFTDDGQPIDRLDLFIDFLPVVHVPNTPASREHFGQSVIDLVAQILDDIQIGDTDISDAAALAAGPVIHSSGQKSTETLEVRPGTVLNGGENSRMDVLDMSKGLSELRSTQDSRLDRLSVNGRVPAEVLGRVDATQTMPGISIALRFGPFTQLVNKLRLTRDQKRVLLLKFVQRLAILGGVLSAPVMPARIPFGSFLPSDLGQLVERVSSLLRAKAISTQTAVAMLVEGGMSIEDARGEVQRIHYENAEVARALADATGSEQLAAEFLGVELPTQTPTVTLPVPPAPGQ